MKLEFLFYRRFVFYSSCLLLSMIIFLMFSELFHFIASDKLISFGHFHIFLLLQKISERKKKSQRNKKEMFLNFNINLSIFHIQLLFSYLFIFS